LALGLDNKLFRAPEIGGIVLPSGDVRSRPYSLIYVGSYQPAGMSVGFTVEYDRNSAGGSYNTDAAYSANRIGASNRWETYKAGYSINAPLFAGWGMSAVFHGQYSPDALIPGEQFGLGGSTSVRGAPERAVTGDTGISTSIELLTPELTENLRALVFTDSGFVTRYDIQPGETAKDGLQSAGLGLRWSWHQSASLSLDYGRITRGSHYPAVPTGSSRVEANLLYRF
jgi:hemolysin activation/secretion protein